jgi:hypothetical protein
MNTEGSLVPIKRKSYAKKEAKKLYSTSVEEHKRKETRRDFSYSDDIEILQREYADVYN